MDYELGSLGAIASGQQKVGMVFELGVDLGGLFLIVLEVGDYDVLVWEGVQTPGISTLRNMDELHLIGKHDLPHIPVQRYCGKDYPTVTRFQRELYEWKSLTFQDMLSKVAPAPQAVKRRAAHG